MFITIGCFAVFSFLILVCVWFIRKLNKKDSAKEGTLSLENKPLASKPITDENGKQTIEKHEAAVNALENKDKLIYAVACGVCMLMWVIALVSGFIA